MDTYDDHLLSRQSRALSAYKQDDPAGITPGRSSHFGSHLSFNGCIRSRGPIRADQPADGGEGVAKRIRASDLPLDQAGERGRLTHTLAPLGDFTPARREVGLI